MNRFAYDDQLVTIPEVVAELVARPHYPPLDLTRPIVFTGIGTSLHAARVAADWVAQLSGGQVRALAADAHDVGTGHVPLNAQDQVVVISHRGYKTYPTASLNRARELGAATIAIVGSEAPPQPADIIVSTCANESAGTFSVSYLAALAALGGIVGATFRTEASSFIAGFADLPQALARSLELTPAPAWVAAFSDRSPILISGFGSDFPTAQEAALKIKEGAWLWTEAMSPEFALHGTPASFNAEMSAIVLLPDQDDGGRSALLADALHRLGLETVATCGTGGQADLRFDVPPHPLLRPLLAVLPFHLLTAELARHRGTDPDTLHGHRTPWKPVMTTLAL